jgi:hypothetical protein
MDVAHRAMVEAELARLLEKRSSREIDADERDELWKASVAAYNARRREENRVAWCASTTETRPSATEPYSNG